MPRHKQESVADWFEKARDLARAERELHIEHWVRISIERRLENGTAECLCRYDLPRALYERRRWVVRWRQARLQCRYPRDPVFTSYGCYDRHTGLRTDFNACLTKLAALKAQVTRAERAEAAYIADQRQNNLFFDEATDGELSRFRKKLARKRENFHCLEENIRTAVRDHERTHATMITLKTTEK